MTTDFPTAPSAYGLNGPSATVTVEKSIHASHTEILTTPSNHGVREGFSVISLLQDATWVFVAINHRRASIRLARPNSEKSCAVFLVKPL